MSSDRSDLLAAMQAYNKAQLAEFIAETGLTWLGLNGPALDDVYLLDSTRARGLFLDQTGRGWVDGALVAESLAEAHPGLNEGYCQALCAASECRDLLVCTPNRGIWNALIAPVDVVARQLHLGTPARLPGFNWARTWGTLACRSDAQELAWIAHGGTDLGLGNRAVPL